MRAPDTCIAWKIDERLRSTEGKVLHGRAAISLARLNRYWTWLARDKPDDKWHFPQCVACHKLANGITITISMDKKHAAVCSGQQKLFDQQDTDAHVKATKTGTLDKACLPPVWQKHSPNQARFAAFCQDVGQTMGCAGCARPGKSGHNLDCRSRQRAWEAIFEARSWNVAKLPMLYLTVPQLDRKNKSNWNDSKLPAFRHALFDATVASAAGGVTQVIRQLLVTQLVEKFQCPMPRRAS